MTEVVHEQADTTGDDARPQGEMRRRIAEFDWSRTPLGPMEAWPQSLKTALDICLTSRSPILLWWGPELIEFYNDAYRPVLGATKHPHALGAPGKRIWPEIWDVIGPLLESVMKRGESTWKENQLLILDRNGYPEETYFTYGYSPIRDESGHVGGVFSSVLEQTERVLSDRRFKTLRELAALASQARSREEACELAVQVLSRNAADIPFALLYLLDQRTSTARLVAHSGIEAGLAASPEAVNLQPDPRARRGWPLAEAAASSTPLTVVDLAQRFGELGDGPWPVSPHTAMVLPLRQGGQTLDQPVVSGFLIAGISARRALDEDYRGFFELAANNIAASIANAHAYEEERKRAESLAALDRAKTEFFSNVSHEFRTPLTLMLGPAEDALRDPNTVQVNRDRAALIHRNAMRLLKLVNSMLDFSRIEAGRIEAVYEATDLPAYTAELASSFRAAVEKAGMVLEVDCEPLDEPVYVDRDMWERVVLNLISNAFKHTFEGSITVRLGCSDDRVQLEVADTGVGIPADQLPRIFERFHRVPNARSRTHEGTGIGLALVHEIVKLHAGTIEVASRESEGTTFTVSIPRGSAHLPKDRLDTTRTRESTALGAGPYVAEALRWLPDAEDETRAGSEPSDVALVALGDDEVNERARTAGARVLLADDNADMRAYVTRLLRANGWHVESVADGEAALAAAQQDPPDLVLTDVMMPRLDGFGLLKAIKGDARTRGVPVVLLSARAGETAKVEGLAAGADDYLVKPFAARELLARVDAQISLSVARRRTEMALRHEAELLRTIERIGGSLTAELDIQRILQTVTDETTRLSGAQFGAFFYNTVNDAGEAYMLYTLSGAPRSAFDRFPMPRNTEVFSHTFAGMGVVRSADITQDARYGKNPPYDGMPKGHLPVVSYMAVPVMSHNGEVIGGLFFGHERANVFNEKHEHLVVGIAGWAGLAIDNARLFKAERRSRESAERANKAKSDFLAAMSHELRTPLNAIQGHVQLLEMGLHGPISSPQRQALVRVQKSQQHLLSLINDVLNFAKLEAGRVEYRIESVNLSEVLTEVFQLVETQLSAKGLEWSWKVDPELMVSADREKLQQILLNLLSNAVKFTEKGSVTVDTPSREGIPDDVVLIRVSDTGCGIPRDKHEAIFDPFVQVQQNLTRSAPGTGLGLSISRDLARGMAGELRVRSEPGKGATFTLQLVRG